MNDIEGIEASIVLFFIAIWYQNRVAAEFGARPNCAMVFTRHSRPSEFSREQFTQGIFGASGKSIKVVVGTCLARQRRVWLETMPNRGAPIGGSGRVGVKCRVRCALVHLSVFQFRLM